MNRPKAQGTAVETAAAVWLRENGFPGAERLALSGANDRGDLRLSSSPLVIAECKRGKRGIQLTPWMRELRTEMQNAGAAAGILISDQRGVGARRVGRWFCAMDYSQFIALSGDHAPFFSTGIIDISPVKLNSEYVPLLRKGEEEGEAVPLAITYTPGSRNSRMVCGPLWKLSRLVLKMEK